MADLPQSFLDSMKEILGEDYEAFLTGFDGQRQYGLRVNTLKMNLEEFERIAPFHLKKVPWISNGYFYNAEDVPAKHPFYSAGLYYLQEPSAMTPASRLKVQPGERVLDLCAAPGGKATELGAALQGEGLLVANDINTARAKALLRNLELFGISNSFVTNEPPHVLAERFPEFFHKIMVDAPCSGEGMFRKDETAIKEWTPENVTLCAERQKSILAEAEKMLKPGGVLVYSTCTFAPAEDEEILLWFLRTYPDFHVEDYHDILSLDISDGNPDFISDEMKPLSDNEIQSIHGSLRLWPHKVRGEGHFAVRLKKQDGEPPIQKKKKKSSGKNILSKSDRKQFIDFISEFVSETNDYEDKRYEYFGDELYMVPEQMPELKGIKLVRAGLHIATKKKNRFEPAHAFAKYLKPDGVKQYYECSLEEAEKYLHGDVLQTSDERLSTSKGFILVCYNGLSLGWGKITNGTIKNHYPKGLRINY